jgi:hypothetical protein
MKKLFVFLFSVIIASSFSAVVLAANHDTSSNFKISKQLVLNDDEPAPAPLPEPAPPPSPEPKPY